MFGSRFVQELVIVRTNPILSIFIWFVRRIIIRVQYLYSSLSLLKQGGTSTNKVPWVALFLSNIVGSLLSIYINRIRMVCHMMQMRWYFLTILAILFSASHVISQRPVYPPDAPAAPPAPLNPPSPSPPPHPAPPLPPFPPPDINNYFGTAKVRTETCVIVSMRVMISQYLIISSVLTTVTAYTVLILQGAESKS